MSRRCKDTHIIYINGVMLGLESDMMYVYNMPGDVAMRLLIQLISFTIFTVELGFSFRVYIIEKASF